MARKGNDKGGGNKKGSSGKQGNDQQPQKEHKAVRVRGHHGQPGIPNYAQRPREQRLPVTVSAVAEAPVQSVFADLAGLRDNLRSASIRMDCSSRVSDFLRHVPQKYRFPSKADAPAVYLELKKPDGDTWVEFLDVDEGHIFFEALRGLTFGFRFTTLEGKTRLPKEIRKTRSPSDRAIVHFLRGLQRFLAPFGLQVLEQPNHIIIPDEKKPGDDRITFEEMKTGATGRIFLEGVELRVEKKKGEQGREKLGVHVIRVPHRHEDVATLRHIEGGSSYVPTFVVEKNARYPREKITGVPERWLDGMEALFYLLRRAYGFKTKELVPGDTPQTASAGGEVAMAH